MEIPFIGQGTYSITIRDQANNKQEIEIFLIDEVTPEFPCDSPLEIIILNDVSGSVDSIEYIESQEFFPWNDLVSSNLFYLIRLGGIA